MTQYLLPPSIADYTALFIQYFHDFINQPFVYGGRESKSAICVLAPITRSAAAVFQDQLRAGIFMPTAYKLYEIPGYARDLIDRLINTVFRFFHSLTA